MLPPSIFIGIHEEERNRSSLRCLSQRTFVAPTFLVSRFCYLILLSKSCSESPGEGEGVAKGVGSSQPYYFFINTKPNHRFPRSHEHDTYNPMFSHSGVTSKRSLSLWWFSASPPRAGRLARCWVSLAIFRFDRRSAIVAGDCDSRGVVGGWWEVVSELLICIK